MKKSIIIVLLLIFSISVLADSGAEICDYAKTFVQGEVPSGIPYNNEILNFYTVEGEVIGHLIIEDKKIESFDCSNTTEPTYTVTVKDKKTIEDIINSEKSIDMLNEKISDKDIIIKGESAGKKLKGVFTRLGIKIASWFT